MTRYRAHLREPEFGWTFEIIAWASIIALGIGLGWFIRWCL